VLSAPLLAVLIQTLTGTSVDALRAPAGAKAIVYIFTSTDCPVSNRYAPEVQRLVKTFAPKGVVFRLIYPARNESEAAIRAHQRAFAYEGPTEALRDPTLALVKFSGATITPEAAVVVNGAVVYRGRIDNRYAELGVERAAPTTHDLADALTATLAGAPIAHPITQAVGCFIADLTR
jgi:thiol-disulfide isomerase/thioredoxin